MRYLPINNEGSLFAPANVILRNMAKECGLPRDLEYWNVGTEKVSVMRPCYHNDEEEDVFTTDPQKVELANAIKLLMTYFNKQ